ncbi:beta-galactosidase [Verrucomicrobiales bacterium BCK34]|nr:beta-galactosidase [Verrucomicrobiales bacterium BCK34]
MPHRFVFSQIFVSGIFCISSLCVQAEETRLSPFGIGSSHVNNRSAKDNARWIPKMREIGIRVYRSPQVSWGLLEKEKGKWDWETLDEQLSYLESQRMETGALLIGTPKWNTADAPGSLPVNNLEGWSNYVKTVVSHLKGRGVTRYEVWNEPPNFTGKDQTPADYAKIVVAAYLAAKEADPDCLVGISAKSAHIHYLEEVVMSGAKDHFDFITLHPYEILDGIASNAGSEMVFMNIIPVLRKMLEVRNPAKVDVPVIFTELGVSSNKGLESQAHGLVKAYVMSIAQGVECVQWFEGRDGDSGPLGLLDREGKERPAFRAYGSMIHYLGQDPKYVGWTLLNDKHCAFVFDGAEGPVMAAWARSGSPEVVEFESDVHVVDPTQSTIVRGRSVELGAAPLFVLDVPAGVIAQAKANRDKPFISGVDYAGADEISIEFGETTIERGLHTRSGAHLAEAVVAYGGSARAGNVPGGNVFFVDPAFLSYSQEPIEIEVEVRRNPENENAGFKLVYESADGFKTAPDGWFTVPDNQKWHRKTWRIEDPKFVNYWGYNFILESDGPKFSNYLIRSVKVKKLPAP